MIPRPIDNSRAIQLDLLQRVSETHAAGSRGGVDAVPDGKKEREEQEQEARDRYEHQPPPDEDAADFSQTLHLGSFAPSPPQTDHPGQLIMRGMDLQRGPAKQRPADGRGGRLDVEA